MSTHNDRLYQVDGSWRGHCAGARLSLCIVVVAAISVGGCKRSAEEAPAGEPTVKSDERAIDMASLERVVGRKGMNVLYVSVDTTRADHLGCYGHPTVKTPNADRIAKEGVRFAWCISSSPLTLVSHSAMMTGSYQYVHGARDNGMFTLAPENVTLAEIFQDEGYSTAAEVAAVVLDARYGLNQGFEVYGDVPMRILGMKEPPRLPLDDEEEPTVPAMGPPRYDVDRKAGDITEHGIALLQEFAKSDKPFFLFLHYYDPHWPLEAPEEFARQYDDPYHAEIAYWDSEFGRVLDEVDRLGLAENTLVVLVSDHGEGLGQHGEYSHACFLYDSTLHVVCMMRCKGTIPAGVVVESQVRLVDMAPTVLEFVGLESRYTPQIQGVSLLPLIANPELDFDLHAYADTITPLTTYQYAPLRALRAEGWKYIHAPKPELYHVADDTLELFNKNQIDSERSFQMRQMLWDLIAESPPSPFGQRGSLVETDMDALTQLRALGYVGTMEDLDAFTTGRELDHFDPVGKNPRDYTDDIQILATALGALRMGENLKAKEKFLRFLERNPDHHVAISSLAMTHVGLEEWEEAAAAYRKSIELQPDAPEEYRKLGLVLGVLKRMDEAEEVFRAGIAVKGHDHRLHLNLAGLLMYLGRHDEAAEQLLEAARMSPKDPMVHMVVGMSHLRHKKPDEALASMKRVLELDPGHVPAHGATVMILRVKGELDEALRKADEAIAAMPDEPLLHYEKALTLAERGEVEAAGEQFARIVELRPDSADAHYWLATNMTNRGLLSESIVHWKKAAELDPENSQHHIRLLGLLHLLQRHDEAIAVYETINKEWPDRCEVHRIAALAYDSTSRPAEAIEVLQDALETCDGDPGVLNDLAWRLSTASDADLRDGVKAVELARKASSLASDDNPYFLDTLAAAYAEMGDFEQAVSIASRAVNIAGELDDGSVGERIAARRELYQDSKPYREQ